MSKIMDISILGELKYGQLYVQSNSLTLSSNKKMSENMDSLVKMS